MTPLKLRIFELVRRAGPSGIGGDDLFAIVYDGQLPRYRGGHDGRGGTRQRNTLKSNIYQINRQLVDYRIVCSGRDRAARYYLRRLSEWDEMWSRPLALTDAERRLK